MGKLKKMGIVFAILLSLVVGTVFDNNGTAVVSAEDITSAEYTEEMANTETAISNEATQTKENKAKKKVKKNKKKVKKHKKKKKKHTHKWKKVYTYQIIEDIGHVVREICKGCGTDITDMSIDEWSEHAYNHIINGENSGFYEKEFKIVTGTHKIKKLKYYKCSCGKKKKKK